MNKEVKKNTINDCYFCNMKMDGIIILGGNKSCDLCKTEKRYHTYPRYHRYLKSYWKNG